MLIRTLFSSCQLKALGLLISLMGLFGCQQPQSSAPLQPATLTAIPAPPTLEAQEFINAPTPTDSPSATATSTPMPTIPPTPTPAFPPFTGPRPIPKGLIGIQVHPFGEDQELIFDQLNELGVGWVKIQISWKLFEPGPDRYDEYWFGEADRFIKEASDRGLRVMVGIAKAPEWSRPTTEEDGPPSELAEFEAFAQLLASRYKGQVAAYEFWNESNLRREWNGMPLNGADFVNLVAIGSNAIRQIDPDAILISGAPAPTGINDGTNAIDDRIYFEEMLAAGIAQHVDAIGYHPYGASNPPRSTLQNRAANITSHNDHPSFYFSHTTSDYQALMEKYGVDLELWGTEFGWGSFENLNKAPPAGAEFMSQLSEWEQAVYITEAYVMAEESNAIGPLILWNLNFGPLLGPDFAESGYSILRKNGSKRPSYSALQAIPKN